MSVAGHQRVSFAHGTEANRNKALSNRLNSYLSSDEDEDEVDRRLREEEEEEEQERLLSERHGEVEEAPTRKKRKEKSDKEIEAEYAAASAKKRQRPTFQPNQLIGSTGLIRVKNEFATSLKLPKNKRSKQDSAAAYSKNVVNAYKSFCYDLFPNLAFEDMLLKIEGFGSKKEVKAYLQTMRDDVRKSHLESIFGGEKTDRLLQELEYGLKQQQESFLRDYDEEENNTPAAVNSTRNPYQTRSVPDTVAEVETASSPADGAEEDELEITHPKDDSSNFIDSSEKENIATDKEDASASSGIDNGGNTAVAKEKETDSSMASASDEEELEFGEDSIEKKKSADKPKIDEDVPKSNQEPEVASHVDQINELRKDTNDGQEPTEAANSPPTDEKDTTAPDKILTTAQSNHAYDASPKSERSRKSIEEDETSTSFIETETQATHGAMDSQTEETADSISPVKLFTKKTQDTESIKSDDETATIIPSMTNLSEVESQDPKMND